MRVIPIFAFFALLAGSALADAERFTNTNKAWKEECGSCHVAYPPQLLPATSWKQIMAALDQHYGADASVDANIAQEIEQFLIKHASRRSANDSSGTQLPRITETRWFRHEHDEVPASVWKHPQVKSAANCGACHTGADSGDFSEHNIRLPR